MEDRGLRSRFAAVSEILEAQIASSLSPIKSQWYQVPIYQWFRPSDVASETRGTLFCLQHFDRALLQSHRAETAPYAVCRCSTGTRNALLANAVRSESDLPEFLRVPGLDFTEQEALAVFAKRSRPLIALSERLPRPQKMRRYSWKIFVLCNPTSWGSNHRFCWRSDALWCASF